MSTTVESLSVHCLDSKSSLQEEVEALGVPILPRVAVRKHKKQMIQACRPGVFRFIGPTILGVMYLSCLLVGAVPVLIWRRYRSDTLPSTVLLLSFGLSLAFLAVAAWIAHWPMWLAFNLPMFGFLATFVLVSSWPKLSTSTSHWEATCITVAGGNAYTKYTFVIPRALQQRAELVTTIPGTRLVIEHFQDDPFLVAERGFGPFAERVYVGAWDTGVKKFDRA